MKLYLVIFVINLNLSLHHEDILREVRARSLIDCSKKCVETEACVMGTFHSSPQGPSPGLCRLHSQLQKDTDEKESKPGARSLQRRRYCDTGYTLLCDHCLRAVKTLKRYIAALRLCPKNGGQLATLKTARELRCARTLMVNAGLQGRYIWVGADDLKVPSVYRWMDGTLLPDRSLLWNHGDPHNFNPGAYCVTVSAAKLWDTGCGDLRPYICQMAPVY